MKRNRRKNRKNRLRAESRESFVLSCTSALSARVIRLFEYGALSPLLSSARRTDEFVAGKIVAPVEKKFGLGRKIFAPARDKLAGFFASSRAMAFLCAAKDRFLATSLRSVGVFAVTFGVYAAAIFLLRRYTSSDTASLGVSALSAAAVAFISGVVLLLFGEKSILSALGNGRVTGPLLCDSLGINDSSLQAPEKGSNSTGIMFLLGSLCGIATLFISPARVLFILLCLLIAAAVINVPEFGLLLAMALLPVIPSKTLSALVLCTAGSYLFKCLRLKRNLRFGTADAAMLLLLLIKAVFAVNGAGDTPQLLCLVCVYFIAKNVICSERLISQALNALCLGASVAAVFWLTAGYAGYIFPESLRNAAVSAVSNVVSNGGTAHVFLPAVPAALSRLSSPGSRRHGVCALVLIGVCAAVSDDILLIALCVSSGLCYFALAHKAPVGALLTALVVLPALVIFADYRASFHPIQTLWDPSLTLHLGENPSVAAVVGGVAATALLAVAALLSLQRALCCLRVNNSRSAALVCGGVAACAIMSVVACFVSDPFADIRVFAYLWFTLGLEGSIYGVYTRSQYYINGRL